MDEEFSQYILNFSLEVFISILYKFFSINNNINYQVLSDEKLQSILNHLSQFNEIEIMRQCLYIMTIINRTVNKPQIL